MDPGARARGARGRSPQGHTSTVTTETSYGVPGTFGDPWLVLEEVFHHLLAMREEHVDQRGREQEALDAIDHLDAALVHVHEAARLGPDQPRTEALAAAQAMTTGTAHRLRAKHDIVDGQRTTQSGELDGNGVAQIAGLVAQLVQILHLVERRRRNASPGVELVGYLHADAG